MELRPVVHDGYAQRAEVAHAGNRTVTCVPPRARSGTGEAAISA